MEAVICGFMYMIVLTAGGMSSRADRIVMPRAKPPEELQCRKPGSPRPAHIPQPSSMWPETASAPRKEGSCRPCRTGTPRTRLHAFPCSGHQQWVKPDSPQARKALWSSAPGALFHRHFVFCLLLTADTEMCPHMYSPLQRPSWKHF